MVVVTLNNVKPEQPTRPAGGAWRDGGKAFELGQWKAVGIVATSTRRHSSAEMVCVR